MWTVPEGPLSGAVALLAVEGLKASAWSDDPPWTAADAHTLRRTGARLASSALEASHLLEADSDRLVAGIEVQAAVIANGVFGDLWAGHPFTSPDLHAAFRLREPDVTRGLERLMSPAAGSRGAQRAQTFLAVLAELTGAKTLQAELAAGIRPVVTAEYPIRVTTKAGQGVTVRIDLLFQWPCRDDDGRSCVVVVEAKFGSAVGQSQLMPYRREALRLAKGGPVACILLTSLPDPAERRNVSWAAVRWPTLMRRWEREIAASGDDDREFTRLRAHIWRHHLPRRGFLPSC